MKSAHFRQVTTDGQSLHISSWLPSGTPKAVLLIIHGMAEHGGRYQRLARALEAEGIAVYALDQRGHGKSAEHGLGCLGPKGSWRRMIEDVEELRAVLRERHPDIPLFMFAHSMGSFLLQQYISERGERIDGAILSATDDDAGPLRYIGLGLMKMESRLLGRDHPSAIAESLTFADFNKPFKPARTEFDWISADEAEVDKYINDPFCGFRCSAGFWHELLSGLGELPKDATRARVPQNLPIYLIAGDRDPVAKYGQGPDRLAKAYEQAGVKDVTLNIYADGRHELLNDYCRKEVTAELKSWLRRRIL